MEKTEERQLLSDKLSNWSDNHKKKIWLITSAIYIILVIIFIIFIFNMNGGIQETLHLLNDYPEQKYQQLEQELENIVVECDGIYPEKLSNDSIKYEILYREHSDSKGKYTITLTDDVTITGTIGKDFKKENLIIEREYKTESMYKKNQYIPMIFGILILPIFPILFIHLIINLFSLMLVLIELPITYYNRHKASKK